MKSQVFLSRGKQVFGLLFKEKLNAWATANSFEHCTSTLVLCLSCVHFETLVVFHACDQSLRSKSHLSNYQLLNNIIPSSWMLNNLCLVMQWFPNRRKYVWNSLDFLLLANFPHNLPGNEILQWCILASDFLKLSVAHPLFEPYDVQHQNHKICGSVYYFVIWVFMQNSISWMHLPEASQKGALDPMGSVSLCCPFIMSWFCRIPWKLCKISCFFYFTLWSCSLHFFFFYYWGND